MLCKNPFVKKATGIEKGSTDGTPFPCGQCLHCRINQGRIWQTRLLLESMTADDSSFLTLTYDDDHLPQGNILVKKHLQDFFKRYRKLFNPHKLRYFAIGEYGTDGERGINPHYHIALFLYLDKDHYPMKIERCWQPCKYMRMHDRCTKDCYLAKSWPFGFVEASQTLGKENAGYITGYIRKKALKPHQDLIGSRPPEFQTMSKQNGGIGLEAINRIAQKFRSVPGTNPRIIRELRFGDRSKPIGGYLESKLSDRLGVSRSARAAEFFEYSQGIIDKYLENGCILTNMLNETESKRHSQIVRTNLYSKKRSL